MMMSIYLHERTVRPWGKYTGKILGFLLFEAASKNRLVAGVPKLTEFWNALLEKADSRLFFPLHLRAARAKKSNHKKP
jgi:hypothetical protein